MLVDPDGLVIVCVVCAVLGFLLGWMSGVLEGRARERAAHGVNPSEMMSNG